MRRQGRAHARRGLDRIGKFCGVSGAEDDKRASAFPARPLAGALR